MERLTVTIESQAAAKLRREARRRHISVSELVRERIRGGGEHKANGKRAIPWAGVGASSNSDLAIEMDRELARTWPDDLKRDGVG